MVEGLTDDALDVIVDIVMEVRARLGQRLWRARQYWLDVTQDWWYEWVDRRSHGRGSEEENNATITP